MTSPFCAPWLCAARAPHLSRIARSAAVLCAALLFVSARGQAQSDSASAGCPPKTHTDDVKEDVHGTVVADPYRWLEDQTSPATRAWIDAENRCTEAVLKKLPGRTAVEQQLSRLMKVDSIGAPFERNGRLFFLRRGADQDLDVLYMRQGLNGVDQVLVDPHPLSPDHSTSIELANVSKDGKLVVYGVRAGGEDETVLHVFDADTRQDLKDTLPRATYFSVAPKPDNSGFYYARATPRGPRVGYHSLGTDAAKDAVIFGESYGSDKILVVDLSPDGNYLLLTVLHGSGVEQTEVYFQNVRAHGPIVPIVNDVNSIFFGEIAGDTLYLRTNWKAPLSRLLAVDLTNPERANWREIVAEGDAALEDFKAAGGKIAALYTRKASAQLKIISADGREVREVSLPALGTVQNLSGRWDGASLYFSFESFNFPVTIYREDVAQRTLDAWAKPSVPIQSDAFEVSQVFYESKDKTLIPMFLFYKKGLRLDGNHPTLLYAYGGFNVSKTPQFSGYAVLWAERGGVYAVANLRGGGEFGEGWHRAGMLANKQNVFDDFIAAGDWLVAQRYTNPKRLAIMGGSNGGLLVGAALTQRPDLFRAVVCQYPLLDMVRYQKFMDGPYWVPEYGSSDRPDQFHWLYAYSPYHHVEPGRKYPAVLFITGDGDTRVAPLHARKMTARLQAATNSGLPVLLLYDTKSGHSGGRPLGKEIEEKADFLCFLFWQLDANID
jgi:prolyl oligopeptidase